MSPLEHVSGQLPQLKPQELVPQKRLSFVHEVESQPEHTPELHVAEAEFIVQSKQLAPDFPQRCASESPGLHAPPLTQPVQQKPLKQMPFTPPSLPTGMQALLSAMATWLQLALQPEPLSESVVQGFASSQSAIESGQGLGVPVPGSQVSLGSTTPLPHIVRSSRMRSIEARSYWLEVRSAIPSSTPASEGAFADSVIVAVEV